MHAKIEQSKTNAIRSKKKHTYTEAGIYEAAQGTVSPAELKQNWAHTTLQGTYPSAVFQVQIKK